MSSHTIKSPQSSRPLRVKETVRFSTGGKRTGHILEESASASDASEIHRCLSSASASKSYFEARVSVPRNPSVKGTSCGKPQAAPYLERRQMERTGKLGRAFILINRAFGASCILAGASMTIAAMACLVRGTTLSSSGWVSGALGVVLIAMGALYFKAPLFRRSRAEDGRDLPK